MKKLILTSTGLTTKSIINELYQMLNKNIDQIRVLFIPTAALTKDDQLMIPLCFQELVDLGILANNIISYNCDRYISENELNEYDIIYFCGGDENYLMKKINECNIYNEISKAVSNNLIFIGVSAGSMIASDNIEHKKGLGLVSLQINPHATKEVTPNGIVFNKDNIINLADNHAIIVLGKHVHIV